jgi:two-component system, NtrC family, sensor kinase
MEPLDLQVASTALAEVGQDSDIVHSARLATIGSLMAGVAHELSTPMGYVLFNIGGLARYVERLLELVDAYERAEPGLADPAAAHRLSALRREIDLDFMKSDIPALLAESQHGMEQLRKQVQDLKTLCHLGAGSAWAPTDVHQRIDLVLGMVHNEVKYKADVVRHYGKLPKIDCIPAEIDLLLMHAVRRVVGTIGQARATLTIGTGTDADGVVVLLEHTGGGDGANASHPLFVDRILHHHGGRIEQVGTRLTIRLPITPLNTRRK